MASRSFNPQLAAFFKAAVQPKFHYGFKHVNSQEACQQVVDRLDLKKKYPGAVDIVDIFPGHGLLSLMINYEVKPRNHVLVDLGAEVARAWKERISHLEATTGNSENFRLLERSGYTWDTFDTILHELKLILPQTQSRDHVHDELLIVGNVTMPKYGEALLLQWMACTVHRNWLQRYGRVRMVLTTPEVTAQKFLLGPNFYKRNRLLIKRAMYTETRLVAVLEPEEGLAAGHDYDPNLLVADQPLVVPKKQISPPGGALAVMEMVPRGPEGMDFASLNLDLLEYVVQILMYKLMTQTVMEGLAQLSPGAEVLAEKLPERIVESSPRSLLTEDFLEIFRVVDAWPFKPSLSDMISFSVEDTRTF